MHLSPGGPRCSPALSGGDRVTPEWGGRLPEYACCGMIPYPIMAKAPSQEHAGERDPLDSSSELRLLERVRLGNRSAVGALFERYTPWLRRWTRGRLPRWVDGAIDTSDLVQDALHHTFERLGEFEPKQANALRSYLCRAVENRIRNELRRAARRRASIAPLDAVVRFSDDAAPQHRQFVDDETWRRYLNGLERLTPRERRLIVGRAELEYSFQQLAIIEDMPSPDAARMALRRAMIRLSSIIGDP